MKQLYIQCHSDYEAAQVILGSFKHWQKLVECTWFKPHLEKWKAEKLARDKALGRDIIIKKALEGNISAAKYLDQLQEDKVIFNGIRKEFYSKES